MEADGGPLQLGQPHGQHDVPDQLGGHGGDGAAGEEPGCGIYNGKVSG